MNFKIEKMEVGENGELLVDLPQQSLDILSKMFPDAKTPEEAFRYYVDLALANPGDFSELVEATKDMDEENEADKGSD